MAGLRRVLGYNAVLLITINSIIGSGMFFLPAIGAFYLGPASILAWILLSLIAIYTAMCFAELVSMYPTAGGIYEFTKNTYGRFTGFLIGWVAWLIGNITTGMLIVGAVQYLLPYESAFFTISKMLLSLFFVFIFNFMAYRGMRTSAFMLVTFAFITLSIFVVLTLPFLGYIDFSNYSPFFIHDGVFLNIQFFFITLFFISETFFGIESIAFLAEETKEPEKILPKALIHGTLIITVLTIALVTISLGFMNHFSFALSEAPFADMAGKLFGSFGKNIVSLWTYLIIIGAAAGWVVTSPRLILALTRDKLFPTQFGEIHPRFHSPYKAIIFQALITSIFIFISFRGEGYKTLLSLLVPFVLFMMSAAVLTVPVLRKKHPNKERPYKVRFGNIGPLLIVALNLFLIFVWLIHEPNSFRLLRLALSFVGLGIPIYLLLSMYYDPKMIRKVTNSLAYITLLTESFMFPKHLRKNIMHMIGDIKEKHVFEFGCSVGTLTLHLAEAVGKNGKIYASDMSFKQIDIAKKRFLRGGHNHIETVYDELHGTRVHPHIPKVDLIVSLSTLSNVQYLNKVLHDMNSRLEVGGRIFFVEYDQFFHIIPNVPILSNDAKIKYTFRQAGFRVDVKRKKTWFWEVIYISGSKTKNI